MHYNQELKLLSMLYQLYNDVNNTIDGLSQELFNKIDLQALEELTKKYQLRCLKLPKQLRQFDAYT